MNKAPKKIWVPEVWVDCLGWEETPGEEIPYIRADIVDELVEALKGVMDAHSERVKELSYQQGILVGDSRIADARAALAKLEESHE